MGRKGSKARRAAAKRARREEEEARRAEEAARQEIENQEIITDALMIRRTFNNPDWEEFAPCADMPGQYLKKKAALDPELTV